MARIRTIKPEFPQSESIGSLSRDARLLFIQLWTVVDDEGRARAASRMLASLLYPYDDDARVLMEGWLAELEKAGMIRRYIVDGSVYLDIPHWAKHQKIDHKSVSRLPAFEQATEVLASPRESSRALAPDLGPRTMDHGPGTLDHSARKRARKSPIPDDWQPSEDHKTLAAQLGVDWRDVCQTFRDYLSSNARQYADYDAAFRNFLKNAPKFNGARNGSARQKSELIGAADNLLETINRFGSLEIGGGEDAAAVRMLPKG